MSTVFPQGIVLVIKHPKTDNYTQFSCKRCSSSFVWSSKICIDFFPPVANYERSKDRQAIWAIKCWIQVAFTYEEENQPSSLMNEQFCHNYLGQGYGGYWARQTDAREKMLNNPRLPPPASNKLLLYPDICAAHCNSPQLYRGEISNCNS